MYSYKTELSDVILSVLSVANKVNGDNVATAQDAMINIRVEFEELQSRLRNKKLDGFEMVVDAMKNLSAVTMAMAAALQSKILQQREMQMNDTYVSSGKSPLTKKRREVGNK